MGQWFCSNVEFNLKLTWFSIKIVKFGTNLSFSLIFPDKKSASSSLVILNSLALIKRSTTGAINNATISKFFYLSVFHACLQAVTAPDEKVVFTVLSGVLIVCSHYQWNKIKQVRNPVISSLWRTSIWRLVLSYVWTCFSGIKSMR